MSRTADESDDTRIFSAMSEPGDGSLRHALAASRTGTWRWIAATGEVRWDATLEVLSGLEPGSFGSTFEAWMETLHPDEREDILAVVDEALDRRGAYHFEHRVMWPDGSERWLECRGEVTTDEAGSITGTVGCATDVTARKQAEGEREALLNWSRELSDRLARLQRISERLAAADDVTAVGRAAVELVATPNTAGSRALWLVDEEKATLELIAREGMAAATAEAFARIPVDSDLPGAQAYRERRRIACATTEEAAGKYPALSAVPRTAAGFVVVPLMIESDCLGVLSVGHDQPELSDLDLGFLEAAAGHLAQTVARVRLTEAIARRAREAAAAAERERRRRRQLEFLGRLTTAAITAADHGALMRTVTAAAVPHLGDWCTLHFLPEPGADVEVADAHVDPERVAWARQIRERHPFRPDRRFGAAEVMRTGRTQFLQRVDEHMFDDVIGQGVDEQELREILDTVQLTSTIAVPLVTKRGIVGAMQFVMAESRRQYDDDDVALAEAAAGRIAAALDVLWFSDQHRHTAATLQSALLPPELPAIAGIDVAARYFPAGSTNEVGGDFYDLFPLGEHKWAVVIGDVCGTGPDAAAVTSIARHTARAAARHGQEHREVLEWVNDAVLQSDRHLFCTAIYGTIEAVAEGWRIRVSAAGHPLPVLRRAGGSTCTVGEPGTLLGILPDITTTTTELLLEPGDALLFYTDGMTDLPAPYGITAEDVVDLLAGIEPTDTADGIADAVHATITARVADAARADDVALMVLRVDSPPR